MTTAEDGVFCAVPRFRAVLPGVLRETAGASVVAAGIRKKGLEFFYVYLPFNYNPKR